LTGTTSGTRTAGDANAAAGAGFSGNYTSTTLGSNNVSVTATSTGANATTNTSNSATATTTVTVLDHSNAAFSVASGSSQRVIVGSDATATFNLTNSGTGRSALDVNIVSAGLTGVSGTAAVASNGSAVYTAALNTSTAGLSQQQTYSLQAGDQQSLSGHNALATLSQDVSVDVLNHSVASFGKTVFDLGTFNLSSDLESISLGNVLNAGGSLAANMDFDSSTGIARSGSGSIITVTGTSFSNLSSSDSTGAGNFLANFSLDGLAQGTYSEQFTLTFLDEAGIVGGTTNSITATVDFTVVPEPSTWAMLMGGVGMLTLGQRLRRKA
jgi:hypothetical protein